MEGGGVGVGKKHASGHYWHEGGGDYFDGGGDGFEKLRIWCHNVDDARGEEGLEEQIPLWKKGGFGVVCLQDLRFSEAEIPMAVEAMKAGWGGAGM